MKKILVIRFGALGDLCLLTWALSHWAKSAPDSQVTLVTKAAWAPLMKNIPGIHHIITLPQDQPGALLSLAQNLRAQNFDFIVDAHNVMRSHLLLMLMGRRSTTRLKKSTTARLQLLGFRKNHASLEQTMNDRFVALFAPLGSVVESESSPPLYHFRKTSPEKSSPIGLAPGAQWESKRWPVEFFATLLQEFRRQNSRPVRIFLGPQEEQWYPSSPLAKIAEDLEDVEVVRGRDLTAVARLLAGCSLLVTNDSGLLHLAEATGTPVLAFFGPTVRQFGYFPRLPLSQTLEVAMECRPCSRNGKRKCHRGDLACLRSLSPENASKELNRMLQELETSS